MSRPSVLKTFLWFNSDLDEALKFYKSTFNDVVIHEENQMDGKLFTADFTIFGHNFIGMNYEGGPQFNESISLSIQCDGQEETDRLWNAISKNGEPGQCGWCKDKWGLSWQVTPYQMRDYLGDSDPEKQAYAWEALRKMKNIVLKDFVRPD